MMEHTDSQVDSRSVRGRASVVSRSGWSFRWDRCV